MKKFRNAIFVLVALNIVVLAGWIIFNSKRSRSIEDESRKIREQHAGTLETIGVMSTGVSQKLFAIKDRVKSTGKISDGDLKFCIEVFEQGPQTITNDNWTTLAIDSSAPIRYCKSLEKGQNEQITRLADQMIEMGHTQQNPGLPCTAMLLLSRAQSPSRTAYFTKLSQSPNQKVRVYAEKCIAKEKS